jgi:hypothetical protein
VRYLKSRKDVSFPLNLPYSRLVDNMASISSSVKIIISGFVLLKDLKKAKR